MTNLQPLSPENLLKEIRGFSGEGGCRLVTPKCHTFLESGSKTQLIGEEKKSLFLKGKKFFFQISYVKHAPSGAGGGFFFEQ